MNSTTCPSCNAPVHTVVATAPFCAWCGKPRGQQLQAFFDQVQGAKAADDSDDMDELFDEDGDDPGLKELKKAEQAVAGPRTEEAPFSGYAGDLCLAFDPNVGFALIGSHTPRRGQPRLRAYDLYNKRVAWEALEGTNAVKNVEDEQLAVRGRNVYVALDRSMQVLDLYTGQTKWGAEFTDKLVADGSHGPERGLRILDPSPPGQRGAVLAFTSDYIISSFDRDSGQLLWRQTRQRLPYRMSSIGQSGLVVFEGSPSEVINPFQQTPVGTLPAYGEIVAGQYGLWRVSNWGWLQREGIVLFDYLANKEVFFEAVDGVESDVRMVMGHGRLFCCVSDEKLFAAPNGRAVPLKEGFEIRALCMVGPTLFALVEKHQGTGYRRVLGVDPQTLAVRFDLGELSTEPNDNWERQMCTNDQLLVLVTSRDQDDDHCELWGVLPTGQVVWKTYVGEWYAHYFLGGHVVVYTRRGWIILRPTDGQLVMAYTR